jgi:hypothetical protein
MTELPMSDACLYSNRPLSMSCRLIDIFDTVLIIAFKESTVKLENALAKEGFSCEVLRQEDKPEYRNFAAIYRCMLNHQRAWKRAANEVKPTLIVEADFVPVIGLGRLPLPCSLHQSDVGIVWLYTTASRIYHVSPEGFAEGFSSSLVAYFLTPHGARCLCGLVDQVSTEHGAGYSNFDAEIGGYLQSHGFKNYIPYRVYGEHGGLPNPEHRRNGRKSIHRADVLFGKLAFLPAHAGEGKTGRLRFWLSRLYARIKAIGRVLTGRYLQWNLLRQNGAPFRLCRFTVQRHLLSRW